MDKKLTDLEKQVLKTGLDDGYIYDDGYNPDDKSHFLTYGFSGKKERGAASSLVKKGILEILNFPGDGTYVYLLISREEAEQIVGKPVGIR